jgi:Holliday junction resolvase RusA-like endonuclease
MDADTTNKSCPEISLSVESASCIQHRLKQDVMTLENSLQFGKRVEFTVYGKVIGKGRPHFVRKTGVAITPATTRSYESVLRDAARHELGDQTPWTGMIAALICAEYKIPKSWTKTKRELAQRQLINPTKPDVDNIGKIVLDALNRVVYEDDTQVVICIITKEWGDRDQLNVVIGEM